MVGERTERTNSHKLIPLKHKEKFPHDLEEHENKKVFFLSSCGS